MNDLIEIIVYATESGKFPFYEWLEDLDKRVMAKVSKRLLRLSMGNFGDCKSLGNELFELRFSEGIRIYFSKVNNKIVLLLTGGNKNNKGEQSRDISKARDFLVDYKERNDDRSKLH